jgi:hypothetical protein
MKLPGPEPTDVGTLYMQRQPNLQQQQQQQQQQHRGVRLCCNSVL